LIQFGNDAVLSPGQLSGLTNWGRGCRSSVGNDLGWHGLLRQLLFSFNGVRSLRQTIVQWFSSHGEYLEMPMRARARRSKLRPEAL
jgi:hypothetical protein